MEEQLIEKNILVNIFNYKEIKNTKNIYKDICLIIEENKPKTAILSNDEMIKVLFSICEKKPIRVEDTMISIPKVLMLESLHYMFDVIEETMQWLIPSGIIQHSEDFYYWLVHREKYIDPDDGPKVLTLNDLSYGFIIWLIAISAVIVEFFMEILTHKIKSRYEIKIVNLESTKELNKAKINEEKSEENSQNDFVIQSENSEEVSNLNENIEDFSTIKIERKISNTSLIKSVEVIENDFQMDEETEISNDEEKSEKSGSQILFEKKLFDVEKAQKIGVNQEINTKEVLEVIDLEENEVKKS